MCPYRMMLPIFLLLMLVSGSVFAEAGIFQFTTGEVRLVNTAGVERAASKGDHLNEGDVILTGSNGAAQIKMADGGFISVRPDTRMKVDSYTYAGKKDGSEKSFFSLMVGGFRALTGLIGKLNKDNYKVTTPSATIGIRGTDHEPMVVLPGQKALGEPGTYDKVNSGASFIATAKGVINIAPNQAGFTPSANVKPVILSKMPAFYKESPPVPVEEMKNLQRLQDADLKKSARDGDRGLDDDGRRKEDQESAAGEKKRAVKAGVLRTLESENEDGGLKGDRKAVADEKRRTVQPGLTQANGSKEVTGAKVPSSPAAGLPEEEVAAVLPAVPALMDKSQLVPTAVPAKTAVPAGGAPEATTPLLAPLPSLSTTTKLAPLGTTTTQPLIAPVTTTTTKSLDTLAAPDSTSTTTTKTLDPALTTTIQPVLTSPTTTTTTTTIKTLDPALTTTIQPILTSPTTMTTTTTTTIKTLDPVLTTTIQPVLTSPTTTTTTTTTSPLLTAPLLSPTTTIIKTLP